MLLERLTSSGPKRILALDGGGIRGAIALGYLERIEQELRIRHDDPDLLLRDYFDLIGGTSTGSIIAAGLATGRSVAEIKDLYLRLGPRVFSQRRRLLGRLESKFDAAALEVELRQQFGDTRLGDEDAITTGLCIVAKRADTRSTWYLLNHPNGRYYPKNKHIRLRDAIRSSTAAPTFFIPQELEVGEGERGAFVDGGVSMENNPALRLFIIATAPGHRFEWPVGRDNILLVSIGTGESFPKFDLGEVFDNRVWDWAIEIPGMFMEDATWHNQMMLQFLSESPTAKTIDREIGTLQGEYLAGKPLLTYLRYNPELTVQGLSRLGLSHLEARLPQLRAMDEGERVRDLAEIGAAGATQDVQPDHFPAAFDLPRD